MEERIATVVKNAGSHYLLSELPAWEPFPAVLRGKVRLQKSSATNPVAVGDQVKYFRGEGKGPLFRVAPQPVPGKCSRGGIRRLTPIAEAEIQRGGFADFHYGHRAEGAMGSAGGDVEELAGAGFEGIEKLHGIAFKAGCI
jgi:hypothetical protein